MKIEVNGSRLFFDVEGAYCVPDGLVMRERPTLLLLHGGPGFDHSGFKPAFARFADIAQVIYLDHRGQGRSDRGHTDQWNLAQWGDDVHAFCRALGIERPIVMGQSFGGFVAMSYATRHPEHPGRLILSSTAANMQRHVPRSIAMFATKGGPEIAAMARQLLIHGCPSEEFLARWLAQAMPFYNTQPAPDPDAHRRAVTNLAVGLQFFRPDGECHSFDMHAALANIQCPTLILGGEADPITPIEAQADIAAAIAPRWVRFARFAGAGHGPFRDDPAAYDVIRDFILS